MKKVRKGDSEAQLTDAFRHFQQYYGFKVQVCNPRKGNEKGHVEGKVGYVRYNDYYCDHPRDISCLSGVLIIN